MQDATATPNPDRGTGTTTTTTTPVTPKEGPGVRSPDAHPVLGENPVTNNDAELKEYKDLVKIGIYRAKALLIAREPEIKKEEVDVMSFKDVLRMLCPDYESDAEDDFERESKKARSAEKSEQRPLPSPEIDHGDQPEENAAEVLSAFVESFSTFFPDTKATYKLDLDSDAIRDRNRQAQEFYNENSAFPARAATVSVEGPERVRHEALQEGEQSLLNITRALDYVAKALNAGECEDAACAFDDAVFFVKMGLARIRDQRWNLLFNRSAQKVPCPDTRRPPNEFISEDSVEVLKRMKRATEAITAMTKPEKSQERGTNSFRGRGGFRKRGGFRNFRGGMAGRFSGNRPFGRPRFFGRGRGSPFPSPSHSDSSQTHSK